MTDGEILEEWSRILHLYRLRSDCQPVWLAQRLAHAAADDLEAKGVTDEDILRLFPAHPTPDGPPTSTPEIL